MALPAGSRGSRLQAFSHPTLITAAVNRGYGLDHGAEMAVPPNTDRLGGQVLAAAVGAQRPQRDHVHSDDHQ